MKHKIGCLIIHGFGGTTSDVEPLNKYLQSKGFVTFCPSLKFSMENRKVFTNVNYREWIQSAEFSLSYLKSKCKNVVIIGFHIGGLVAVNFATRFKNFAVVTINAPISYWDIKNIYYNILIDFKTRDFKNVKRYAKVLTEYSVSELVNFKMLLGSTKSILETVKAPIFIAQSLMDDSVDHRSGEYIYKKVSSNLKVLKYYDKLNYNSSDISDYHLVFDDIEKFIKKTLQRENSVGNRLLSNYKYLNGTYN